MTIAQLEKTADKTRLLTNEQVASLLDEIAELLEAQNANPFRVRAYRSAGETLRRANGQVAEILAHEGESGLVRWPGIGQSLARAIHQLTLTGELALLSRLRGDVVPERLFATVPGIGRELARRIHEQLDIESLADLEVAAYDGRLAAVEGMGQGRLRAVRESLAGRFRSRPRIPESRTQPFRSAEPTVAELLDIDEEYRGKAKADRLTRVSPRRFNPTGEAWLPIMHTQRDHRHYTALYSNTFRAHELGKTHDWVVIYRDDGGGDGQWTIVTARYGPLKSKRIVRGREQECRLHYADLKSK